jgi:uncharacterized repeat protein (TIGR01451 family)
MKQTFKVGSIMILLFLSVIPCQAQAILGTATDGNSAIVFPTPGTGLPTPTQQSVTGFPSGATPHGVSYYGSDNALISDFNHSRVFVVKISTRAVIDTIDTSAAGYSGNGSIAVSPNLSYALASGDSSDPSYLYVIGAPFSALSPIQKVLLPGSVMSYQTQAIVFNTTGQAFVRNTAGISVLNPPYNSIEYTIPVSAPSSGSNYGGGLAITPNGNQLLTTQFANQVLVFTAPFSSASAPSTINLPATSELGADGIAITPDGSKALVCAAYRANIFSIYAPFSSTSAVDSLTIPSTFQSRGFEDIGISADGQLAIATGNSPNDSGQSFPAAFIRAPFTTLGAIAYPVNIPNGGVGGRGAGAVRFLPPGLAPGLQISATANITGTTVTYTLTYTNSGTAAVNGVVVRHPIPGGTTYVSCTGGGA